MMHQHISPPLNQLETALARLCELYGRILIAEPSPAGVAYALLTPEDLAMAMRDEQETVH